MNAHYTVLLPEPDDFTFWRDSARRLVQSAVHPDQVTWAEPGGDGSLFGGDALPVPATPEMMVRASKPFIALAKNAALHSDPLRFALLYRLLWRLQANSRLLEDKADADVRRLTALDREVRRDSHKMHAFVRFRLVEEEGAGEHYVAWFEPEHHILRANAAFFVRRFANMRWSILTPRLCLHWDGEVLREGPPARKSDAPAGDPAEDLWRTYYSSIFNPARLKVGAMVKEMPRRYWKNLPEAELIPVLVAGAQAREAAMVAQGKPQFDARPETLPELAYAIHSCRNCPIGALENHAVAGEGPLNAALMIVGEQPGDNEDVTGRPFVGPAGEVLDAALAEAGIDRRAAYLTNAVKHFKYMMQGKRRLHQTPAPREIDMCRWWLEAERAIIRPKLVLALGANAARSLLGKTVSLSQARGQPFALADGSELWIAMHPAYLLRLDGAAQKTQSRLFADDLRAVKNRLAQLQG